MSTLAGPEPQHMVPGHLLASLASSPLTDLEMSRAGLARWGDVAKWEVGARRPGFFGTRFAGHNKTSGPEQAEIMGQEALSSLFCRLTLTS